MIKNNETIKKSKLITYELKKSIKQLPYFKDRKRINFFRSPIKYYKAGIEARRDWKSIASSIDNFVVQKTTEETSQRRRFLPTNVNVRAGEIEIDNKFYRVLRLGELPHDSGFTRLQNIVNLNMPFTLTVNVKKIPKKNLVKIVSSQMSQIESEKAVESQRGKIRNSELDPIYADTLKYYEELQQVWQEGFSYSMSARLEGDTLDDLNTYTTHFLQESANKGFTFYKETNYQKESFKNTLPIAEYDSSNQYDVSTDRLTGILPIFNKLYNDVKGIAIGISHANSSMLLVDFFKTDNFHGAILGRTRNGKSYLGKNMVWQLYLRGIFQIIIDPQGEWVAFANEIGGSVQTLLGENSKKINPFYHYKMGMYGLTDDLIMDIETDHIIHISGLFELLWGENYKEQESKFRGLLGAYFKFIPAKQYLQRNTQSFLNFCLETKDVELKSYVKDVKPMLLELDNKAPFGRLLSGTNEEDKMLDWKNNLVVIDLSNITSEKSMLINLYTLMYQMQQVAYDPTYRKIIWVDEAHLLFKHYISGNFLKEMSKTALKKNTGIWVITQELEDFKESNGGKTILNQCEYIVSFQMPSSLKDMIEKTKILDLKPNETQNLLNLKKHNFCLITRDEHINALSLSVPLMHDVFHSDPDKKK